MKCQEPATVVARLHDPFCRWANLSGRVKIRKATIVYMPLFVTNNIYIIQLLCVSIFPSETLCTVIAFK